MPKADQIEDNDNEGQQEESRSPTDSGGYSNDLHLEPLMEADFIESVRSMLGGHNLPDGLFPWLVAETDGNPFLMESVIQGLIENDLLVYDGKKWTIDLENLSVPDNVKQSAQHRLKWLSENADTLDLLQWAAVLGARLDMEVLSAVSDLPSEKIRPLLVKAAQQQLLVAGEQAGRPVYNYGNELIRLALYNTLSAEEKARRHLRTGKALLTFSDEAESADLLAWHFEQAGDLNQALQYLKMGADKAKQIYENEIAIQFYQRALNLSHQHPGFMDAQGEYDLLAGREVCFGLVGEYQRQQADLDEMMRLAKEMKDSQRQIKAAMSQVTLANLLGNHVIAQQSVEEALNLARKIGDRGLEAESLTLLGSVCNSQGDYAGAQACHEEALQLCRQLGDLKGEAISLLRLGGCVVEMGRPVLGQEYCEQALTLYQKVGDKRGEAAALNTLGTITSDQARARFYYEQALTLYQLVGDRTGQANLYNNLALVYWGLGLYRKARNYLEQAVQAAREMQGRNSLASFLESLGRVLTELEDFTQAQKTLEDGLALSQEIGDRLSETLYWMMLGRVALFRGQPTEARDLIERACNMHREMGTQGYLATSLAWLGASYLAMGDWQTAYNFTSEAVAHLKKVGKTSDYPAQDVWWLYYQVLKADSRRKNGPETDEEAWECLQHTHAAMLAGIATLSDEGLRRNYLNKVRINRDINTEWMRVSTTRKNAQESPSAGSSPPEEQTAPVETERVHDRLKRLLDISLQMNATLDPEALLDFVMDHVIEFSGAERGFLVLVDENGQRDFRVARGMLQDEIERARSQNSYKALGLVTKSKAPVLLQDVLIDEHPDRQNSLRELELRSVLCLPLLRRSELIGMIYADNRLISGRFTQADVDLLSIFANQSATAIENARLFHQHERRITELSILNEIGRSLSSALNLEQLLSIVHQQVGRIFATTNFYIATHEEGENEWTAALQIEDGQRQPVSRHQLGSGLTGYILRSRKPVLLHTGAESRSFKDEQGIPPVGNPAKSWMGVPLITADKVVGVMAIQSYERENLYNEQDLNLFSTIGAQVAIAIRNARLYEETTRTNRELEAFSYSVSHDLRAPLRAINGFSQILIGEYADKLGAEGEGYLQRVREASQRMGELIEDLLRLSRVTRSEMRRVVIDMSAVAGAIMDDLRNSQPERQVDIVIAPSMVVNADSNLIRVVLENLLGNAWKFTQKHAAATIEFGVTQDAGQTVYFVRDDGAGFNVAYAEKLFGAFQRLHTDSEFEGTGIGLTTVQRIVHRHGGRVWAKGEVEKGATFYFTLSG